MINRLASLLEFAKEHVPFHRRRAPGNYLDLAHWPLMTKHDLEAYSLDKSNDLLSPPQEGGGYIVASGGTTFNPKYVYYSQSELSVLVNNMASSLMANGIEPGDRVVNYFTSGDMWSAFLMEDKVLSLLPVTIFPLGCSLKKDSALQILENFKPNVILGIPSMILNLALYCAEQRKQVRMQKVFYGGEAMTSTAMDLISSIWGCELIRSVGYASTDAGSIGWQCPHCKSGEHYAFDDVLVEIIDGEIVVTSLFRRAMPVIRYRTGDGGGWVTPSCDCGNGAPLFKLLGRIDNVIIIWGCWVLYDEIEATFKALQISYTAIQVQAYAKECEQYLLVKFESQVQSDSKIEAQLRDMSYLHCLDAKDSVAIEMFQSHVFFKSVPIGTLKRNDRTGKVIPIIDLR